MRYCGRPFTEAEIELIRALITASPALNRARLSRAVCEQLSWRRPDGRLKEMSCRVAMLRMAADGLITLPPPRKAKPVAYLPYPEIERATSEPAILPEVKLADLTLDVVAAKGDSLIWNTYIQRYHYLGHQLIPGAQLRYFVRAADQVIALLSFGASAWKTRPRDELIGWTDEQRMRNLHLVVNNARFFDSSMDSYEESRFAHPRVNQQASISGLAGRLCISTCVAGNLRRDITLYRHLL